MELLAMRLPFFLDALDSNCKSLCRLYYASSAVGRDSNQFHVLQVIILFVSYFASRTKFCSFILCLLIAVHKFQCILHLFR